MTKFHSVKETRDAVLDCIQKTLAEVAEQAQALEKVTPFGGHDYVRDPTGGPSAKQRSETADNHTRAMMQHLIAGVGQSKDVTDHHFNLAQHHADTAFATPRGNLTGKARSLASIKNNVTQAATHSLPLKTEEATHSPPLSVEEATHSPPLQIEEATHSPPLVVDPESRFHSILDAPMSPRKTAEEHPNRLNASRPLSSLYKEEVQKDLFGRSLHKRSDPFWTQNFSCTNEPNLFDRRGAPHLHSPCVTNTESD